MNKMTCLLETVLALIVEGYGPHAIDLMDTFKENLERFPPLHSTTDDWRQFFILYQWAME